MGTVCTGFILESDVGVEQLANQKLILPIRLLSDLIIYPEKDQKRNLPLPAEVEKMSSDWSYTLLFLINLSLDPSLCGAKYK